MGLNTPPPEEILGSGDIQSLADLNNSYDIVRDMRTVPFGLDDISRLALATAAPLAPLLLTIFSPRRTHHATRQDRLLKHRGPGPTQFISSHPF